MSELESVPLPIDDELEIPSPEEFEGYNGNGTYTTNQGEVKHSYHVRRVLTDYTKSMKQVVAESQRFVMGIPALLTVATLFGSVMSINAAPDDQIEIPVPKGSRNALSPDYYPAWHEATWKELSGLYTMGCIEYVREDDVRVKRSHVLPCHMVYTTKWDGSTPANFLKCKGRCVAGGNHEPAPENVFEHFSPTAGPCINRLTDAYCVYRGYTMWTTDCTQAFLNSQTKHDIFVRPPPGCHKPGFIWRLKRYLYGLKSAPAAWMETLSTELHQHGFKEFDDDPCLMRYFDKKTETEIIAEIFVDDVKWCTNNTTLLSQIITKIGDKY